jgi:hypothetical protein
MGTTLNLCTDAGYKGAEAKREMEQRGYVYEALEVDEEHKIELFFAPRVGKDVSNLFLDQIGQSDPESLHPSALGLGGLPF